LKRTAGIVFLFIFFFSICHIEAKDTDVYVLTYDQVQVQPDALFILDLSGSMRWTPAGGSMYISSSYSCGNDVAYYSNSGSGHTKGCTIDPYGTVPKWSNDTCSGPFYRSSRSGYSTDCSRITIAKRAIKYVLDDNDDGIVSSEDETSLGIRFGYIRFTDGNDTGGNYGSGNISLIKALDSSYSSIMTSVNNETANSGTPLANSLNEARLYLNAHKANDSAANCRPKFVILLSDGADTYVCSGDGSEDQRSQYKRRRATVARAKALADAGYQVFVVGFGATLPHYSRNTLNWAAYYGKSKNPLETQSGDPTAYNPAWIANVCQDSTTNHHNIESDGDHYYATSNDPGELPLSGYAFLATNATQLNDAIRAITEYIANLMKVSTAYVAPVVPVSQFERYNAENRIYLGMFKPADRSFWTGSIKKYGLATENTGNYKIGDILDANNQPAMENNRIRDDLNPNDGITQYVAQSYWSSAADGGDVEKGGVGEVLLARTTPRNIYTYLPVTGNPDLSNPSNAFSLTNVELTPEILGLAAGNTVGRQKLIDFIHGMDAYDWNEACGGSGVERPDGKRCWILGSFIHSRPLIIHYGSNQSVIFAGANDGMLHAFDDATGEELWAFIPNNLLGNLKNLTGSLIEFFVDGSPRAYIQRDGAGNLTKAILIFGQRRGGNRYTALDVTNRLSPRLLYEISPSTSGFGELGQTWSTPQIGKIRNGSGEKWVAFIGGGYDMNQDNVPVTAADSMGRAIYCIDILTGQLIWKYSRAENPTMSYSIPSDIARVDTDKDGKIDRLYVGDMGGRMWRFNIGDAGTPSWTGEIIFTAHSGGKIFSPPDITLENDSGDYEMILFGTGDREDPKGISAVNRLYAVKDRLPYPHTPMTESDLEDLTEDLLQTDLSQSEKDTILARLKVKNGWYVQLNERPGEKCLSTPVVFYGAAYYTTYTPPSATGDVCFLREGTARGYVVDYRTGMALFNLDAINDTAEDIILRRSDRSKVIGSAIPSGVIITFIAGHAVGYVGVGGGVYLPELLRTNPLVPINWKIVF
jgi:Neisseria PilC beta-propeller domain